MNYELSYFIYSLMFLGLWGILFWVRKDIRRKMLLVSLVVTPFGPLSELWYLRDYWQPPTITGYAISIEDAIFAFAIGGITFSIYKVIFNMTITQSHKVPRRDWLIGVFGLIVLAFLFILTNWLRINSIFSSSSAFIVLAMLSWRLRPDLIKPSITTGILILLIFVIIYQLMEAFFPSVLLRWCTGCNPTNIRFLGINVEELIWDFSWGLIGSIMYEIVTGKIINTTGKGIELKNGKYFRELKFKFPQIWSRFMHKLIKLYSLFVVDYDSYRLKFDKDEIYSLNSLYGSFMAPSANKILSIRLVRELSIRLLRVFRHRVSINWAVFLLLFFRSVS